jgi:aryl-alcohol dehydrogenase-like predicted oxidoreductase
MKTRTLGRHGPEVATVGLGCMGMSEFYGPSSDEESIRVIHHAIDHGANLLDTADMYGSGQNERLLGRALKGRRERAVVATKFAILRGEGGSFQGISGQPAHVKAACDQSLARLGIDTIDLYYQHRVDPQVPIEETVGAMAELVKAGKVRYLGLSEAAPATIRRAAAVHPIAALQTEYSLWSREPEDGLLDLCAELGITFVAYSPLGRGFLTGRYRKPEDFDADDYRRHAPRFAGENFTKNLDVLAKVEAIAKQRRITPAQLALAWVLAKAPHTVTIPGTRSITRLEENLAAAEITLSPPELAAIDAVAPKGFAAGTRYPEAGMKSINR